MDDNEYTAEEWRAIPDIVNYEASSFGRIKRTTARTRGKVGIVKLIMRSDGRWVVNICDGPGRRWQMGVHRLVCAAFNGPSPEDKQLCCHKDGDLKNNRADNLYWGDQVENMADALRHGTFPCGARNPNSKLSDSDVLAMRSDQRTHYALAKVYNVNQSTIRAARIGKCWRHI